MEGAVVGPSVAQQGVGGENVGVGRRLVIEDRALAGGVERQQAVGALEVLLGPGPKWSVPPPAARRLGHQHAVRLALAHDVTTLVETDHPTVGHDITLEKLALGGRGRRGRRGRGGFGRAVRALVGTTRRGESWRGPCPPRPGSQPTSANLDMGAAYGESRDGAVVADPDVEGGVEEVVEAGTVVAGAMVVELTTVDVGGLLPVVGVDVVACGMLVVVVDVGLATSYWTWWPWAGRTSWGTTTLALPGARKTATTNTAPPAKAIPAATVTPRRARERMNSVRRQVVPATSAPSEEVAAQRRARCRRRDRRRHGIVRRQVGQT